LPEQRPTESRDRTSVSRALGRLLGLLIAFRAAWRAVRTRTPTAPRDADEVDPSRRVIPASRRAETLVAVLLLAAAACGFAFTVIYVVLSGNTQLLGLSLGLSLLLLAAAAIVAGKFVVPQETAVEPRGPLLVEEETEEVVELIDAGGEGISRRVLLASAGGVAGAALITAAATPLASLGPKLEGIHTTDWRRGVRLTNDDGKPYLASDIQVGTMYTALPEGGDPENLGSSLIVVRLLAHQIDLPAARRGWAPDGVLAYSKICPHAACAISLYRYPTFQSTSTGPAFTCPCHYSTFSPGDGGKLLFGPAGRSLPQLPLMIDAQGYLRAAGPFHEDIGPAWWNTHRAES
jgi:ubiquinol-cytochrome c reductase iron-sulfur subunit